MRNKHTLIVREGLPYIAIAVMVLLILIVFRLPAWLSVPWFILTVWVVAFFRNPERVASSEKDELLAPADGEVVAVEKIDDDRYGLGKCRRVCIFMSPLNVHVNRVPINGTVLEIRRRPGRFHVASSPLASDDNEQTAVIFKTDPGQTVVMVQIAGKMARRIVTYPQAGDQLQKGQRFGLIRFGSRVDLYLPLASTIKVAKGERVFGGSSIIGRMPHGDEGNE